MPTYDYKCTKCGYTFELFQRMTEEPKKRCPECRGKLERLIGGGAGLLFKGSGFYITDYRSDSYKSAAKAEQSPVSKDTSRKKSGTGSAKKD